MEVGCPVFLDPIPGCCQGCSLTAPSSSDREDPEWVDLRQECVRQLAAWIGFSEPWHPRHEADLWRRLVLHGDRGFGLTGLERSLLTLAVDRGAKGRDELLGAPFWDAEGEAGGGLDWLLAIAAVAHNSGQAEEALAWATEAARIAPHDLEVVATLGTILHRAGRWAEVEILYANALKEHPTAAKLRYNRAKLRFQLGELDGAHEDLSAAVASDPYSPQAWNDLGVVLRQLADREVSVRPRGHSLRNDEALSAFNAALDLDAEYAPAWHNKGLLHEDRRELELASHAYQKALQVDPGFGPAAAGLERCRAG